jgi:hypothetical protein
MSSGTCESCGRDADDLETVHRIYLTPETWDQAEKAQRVDEPERWCFPCRTHYPHEEAAGA